MFETVSKTDLNRLKNAVNGNQKKFKYSGIFKFINEEFSIGTVANKDILLSPLDKLNINKIFLKYTNIDLKKDIPDDRLGMSSLNPNEKLAKKSPRDEHISLRSFSGTLYINEQIINILENSFLTINQRDIESVEHDYIIVVENLVAFENFYDLELDKKLNNPLIIYRGDGKSLKATKDFIKRICEKVIVFADIDPSGFVLAFSYNPCAIVYPNVSDEIYLKYASKIKYSDQISNITDNLCIQINKSGELRNIFNQMTNLKAGLQQEQIISNNMKLNLAIIN